MSELEVLAGAADIVKEVPNDDSFQLLMESPPAELEGWDSQAHVGIVVADERSHKIRFAAEQVERLRPVEDLVCLVGAAFPSQL